MTTERTWTAAEQETLAEARAKLTRAMNRNAVIAVGGVVLTLASFVIARNGGGVVFFGAVIAGAGYAYQGHRQLKKLDTLHPGDRLDQSTLGVRTAADPPPPSQKRGAMILGGLLLAVIVAIVVMFAVMG